MHYDQKLHFAHIPSNRFCFTIFPLKLCKMSRLQRKQRYSEKLSALLHEYPNLLVVTIDNIGSKQLQLIRKSLRGDSVVLLGKKTMMKRCIINHIEETKDNGLLQLLPFLVGNVGLIFTKGDFEKVRKELATTKVVGRARVGLLAPEDVVVPPGNTGLDPSHASFFQALKIPTRISKGSVEIISEVELIKKGEKVGTSEAALLSKLGVTPFSYSITIVAIYYNGCVSGPEILDITEDGLVEKFSLGVSNIASISLAISYPTLAAAPHMMVNAYKNVLAVALEIAYLRQDFFNKVHNLPEAIVETILAKFPVQSLLQFRSVSHHMRYVIDDPRIELMQYDMGRESYLVYSRGGSFCQAVHWRSTGTTTKIFTVHIDKLFDSIAVCPYMRGSCNGLLLFSNLLGRESYIVSPMRGQLFHLPRPSSSLLHGTDMLLVNYTYGLGFWDGRYKVVFVSKWKRGSDETLTDQQRPNWISQVLTVGERRWRILKCCIGVQGLSISCGRYICWSEGDTTLKGMVCFDVKEEKYVMIQWPRREDFVSPYLVDLIGIVGIVYIGVFKGDYDIEIFKLRENDGNLIYSAPYQIKISQLIGTFFDMDRVKVMGMVGEQIIIHYQNGNMIYSYNIKSGIVAAHGSVPDWAVTEPLQLHPNVQFHTPKAGMVSLSQFDGYLSFDEVTVRDGSGCSWWGF